MAAESELSSLKRKLDRLLAPFVLVEEKIRLALGDKQACVFRLTNHARSTVEQALHDTDMKPIFCFSIYAAKTVLKGTRMRKLSVVSCEWYDGDVCFEGDDLTLDVQNMVHGQKFYRVGGVMAEPDAEDMFTNSFFRPANYVLIVRRSFKKRQKTLDAQEL